LALEQLPDNEHSDGACGGQCCNQQSGVEDFKHEPSLLAIHDERSTPMNRTLVVKSTAGLDDPERCSQAFTVAATAASSGVPVSLWLTGEAAWLAVPGRAEELTLAHAAPLVELLAAVLAMGTVTVCTQCAVRRGIEADGLLPGVRIAGAAAFLEEVLEPEAQALVY
jgi:predicted peroxiredoxin